MIRALILLALMATAAQAQMQVCGETSAMLETLTGKYGETPFARGIMGKNRVQLLVDPADNSWTMLMITPQGGACIIGTGEDFEAETPVKVGQPS